MNFPLGTHAKMICGLELDSISHPVASDVGMGELDFKRRSLPFCGFNVAQSFFDCDFSGCKKKKNR